MTLEINLPKFNGTIEKYQLSAPKNFTAPDTPLAARICYSAAHVVANPLANINPTLETAIDWDATLSYRHHLWKYGLGVAEAMDTAQRGMGLGWETAKVLIEKAIWEAKSVNGLIACGAGTDHLAPADSVTIDDVMAAYEDQVSFVEKHGGRVILMASRALARIAKTPDDYQKVYGKILSQVRQPVILHWLGEMFDPNLKNYWGTNDLDKAMRICLQVIEDNADKIDGIKISLLSAEREIDMRRQLPAKVKMFTGDDFNYDELIRGDKQGFSHALLGIFDAIAPAASAAIQALEANDLETYRDIFAPTIPLSRHIFQTPTYFYKTGIVFLAYLNGHQNHFKMVGGQESARSIVHLAELFRLADSAGLLANPETATVRMKNILALAGVENG
jgi:hypothetical protein